MGSLELLLAAADRALFTAKEDGGDRHVIAGTRAEVFADRDEPGSPSTQRGSLQLESGPGRVFQLVPASRVGGVGPGSEDGDRDNQGERLPRGSERVLVVNDDASERKALVQLMTGLGYKVIDAPDGDTALEKARAFDGLDLVLADLIMPGMGGFTLIDQFEREFGLQRVLYLLGNVQGEISWREAPGAQVGFISKPTDAAELAVTARELLDCPLAVSEPVHAIV